MKEKEKESKELVTRYDSGSDDEDSRRRNRSRRDDNRPQRGILHKLLFP